LIRPQAFSEEMFVVCDDDDLLLFSRERIVWANKNISGIDSSLLERSQGFYEERKEVIISSSRARIGRVLRR